jgi:hypothetical protein
MKKEWNKRGWIRIIEAFIAVLLIAGVLLVVINKGYLSGEDVSEKVYKAQISVLREIELDSSLRGEIINVDMETNPEVPQNVLNRIENRIPDYLTCASKLCKLDEVCALEEYIEKDVYAQAVAITATIENYNPRQLKLFCWVG